jgi:alcohol dehydrogenase (cytochrome c)
MESGPLITAIAMAALAVNAAAQVVPYQRIRDAEREPGSWLTYSGSYRSTRHSPLTEISPANVSALRPVWIHQLENTQANAEVTPIVADGVMYITEPMSVVTALDLEGGRVLWRWSKPMPKDLRALGFPPVNRGVAILDSTVYVGTLDAHLVALDARSGAVRWDVVVADNKTGHAITVAPLALRDRVIVGISGGEAGIRGFLDAYDARTGARLWRFWTVPAPGEPGSETWAGDSWRNGGAPTWVTGSYDPELNLLYWGIGNPGPDWNGDVRPGDNLYSCSLVALDPETGKLRWHFQFTPHDTHDWDANQIPVLVDAEVGGRVRKLVVTANRNAFYYVLDRETGEFLRGVPFAKQTWARGLDSKGRPIVIPGSEPSDSGTLVYPSLQGATNWFSPTYDPASKLFFVAVREMGAVYFKREAKYVAGEYYNGGGEEAHEDDRAWGAVRALDVLTGERRWEFKLLTPPWAGLLSTAGGLVFGGSNEGNFYALDARTGTAMWQFPTGGSMSAAPISFLRRGRQHIAVASKSAIIVFGLADGGH